MHTGSCLCGGVQFRIEAALELMQVCHCSQCRKAQGTPFATNTPVSAAAFHLLSGAELLTTFESSPGKERVFCGRCGSPIFSRKDTIPGVLRIRAGLLDGDLPARPAAHHYTGSKANWWAINDDLPQSDGPAGG